MTEALSFTPDNNPLFAEVIQRREEFIAKEREQAEVKKIMPSIYESLIKILEQPGFNSDADHFNYEISVDTQNKPINVSIEVYRELYGMCTDFLVDIKDLPYELMFRNNHDGNFSGSIQSKERNRAEFTMHTPMGSSSDRGPKWKHAMTLQEANNYDSLLKTLTTLTPTNKKPSK